MIAYLRKLPFFILIASTPFITSCSKVFNSEVNTAYFGGEIINPNSKYVFLCKDNDVIDTIVLDDKNRFLKKYDSLTPGMYTFKHDPEYQHIYFDKNDSLMIRLNTNEFDNSLTFCGRGEEKNNFLIELFLKNEEDKNASFAIYDQDFKTFSKAAEQDYSSRKSYYSRRKADIKWNDEFDLYAKSMLEMHYLSKKEMYPYIYKKRTNKDACKALPKNYYAFRKNIDFNNDKLTNFSPFVRYLTSMMNNMICLKDESNSLENNIKKLNVADSIFTNVKIKDKMLNNIAYMYLLDDQNMINNKKFLENYFKLSTNKEMQKEIREIETSIQKLTPNNVLPPIGLVDIANKSIGINKIITGKTVVFFWTSDAQSHMELVHQKASELKIKHPDWNFVSININDTEQKWKEIVTKYNFKNTTELRATNFEELKKKWVLTKTHRSMLINKNGTIINGFVSLFDAKFEDYLE